MAKAENNWTTNEDMPVAKLPTVAKDKAEILSRMSDMAVEKLKFKGAIYGDMGTGKTIAAMALAKTLVTEEQPFVLYIDTAENWASLIEHPELMKNTKRYRFDSWDDNIQIARWLNSGEVPFNKIACVVYDEYSAMVHYDLAWITKQRSAQAEMARKDFRDPYWPQLPDYMAVMHRSNILIDGLMKLDKHLIFVSHAVIDKDTRWMGPDMPGATRRDFARKLHALYYAHVDKIEGKRSYLLRTAPLESKRIAAKGRFGSMNDVVNVSEVIEAYKKWGLPKNTENAVPYSPPVKAKELEKPLANSMDELLDSI